MGNHSKAGTSPITRAAGLADTLDTWQTNGSTAQIEEPGFLVGPPRYENRVVSIPAKFTTVKGRTCGDHRSLPTEKDAGGVPSEHKETLVNQKPMESRDSIRIFTSDSFEPAMVWAG